MSLALVHSRARVGVHAPAVRVEVHLSGGLPATHIVGLPEAAVRESRDRVRSALLCAQFEWPQRRITINLAPADLPKDGGRFDLPIALGILAASGQLPIDALADLEFIGELALTGELRPVSGILSSVLAAHTAGRSLIVPASNQEEAALARSATCHAAQTLLQVCAHLTGKNHLPAVIAADIPDMGHATHNGPDLADVRGQIQVRRALEIAAAGGHHLLMAGPPGCGKTLLASCLPRLLPPLADAQALETAAVQSAAGISPLPAQWRCPPFRAPHHTASAVALVGGGSHPRPGEISLAHHGVLFLDELTEWQRGTLDVLREPLEAGTVSISRSSCTTVFPARFQLIAAMNPCPCGWAGDPSARCCCSPERIGRYFSRLSGPLLDRIDLQVHVPRLPATALTRPTPDVECSATVAARVIAAQEQQYRRAGLLNAHLDARATHQHCALSPTDQDLLETAIERLQLSARSMQRILRVARTIADLRHLEQIDRSSLSEALSYRQLDRHQHLPA